MLAWVDSFIQSRLLSKLKKKLFLMVQHAKGGGFNYELNDFLSHKNERKTFSS